MCGFSVAEIVLLLVVIGLLAAIVYPALLTARARIDVAAARDAFASTHTLARRVATQYGHMGKLYIDTAGNRFWVTVDTSSVPGRIVEDTVQPVVRIAELFGGVRMTANRSLLCFNPRGLGTAAAECDLANATVVFTRRDMADTATISRVGRVLKR